jgi:hypothetical protein
MLQGGTHAKHFGVGLGMNQAGNPSQVWRRMHVL